MADVLLHDYVEQLRERVHSGRMSDALTLGQHILRYYPKHIETYVVLAQASLESDDLAGATDLFRRVLSADPENVLALAGMALISEAQDKNDEALWYLERAYEIQPTNDELRRELVRVRELYYGAASERLELTPGALARIYARQGQYVSAINEFRRLLRTESKRFDARVALAETLYRAGRADEAAQLAQNIMADAPFALKPNLILGALWSENGAPEGQEFLARARALDPESRVARDLIGSRFGQVQPPRLPSLDEQIAPSQFDNQVIGLAYSEPIETDRYALEQAELSSTREEFSLSQVIEEQLSTGAFDWNAIEAEAADSGLDTAAAREETIPELAAKEAAQAEEKSTRLETAATVSASAAAAQLQTTEPEKATATTDATLAEIAAAEKEHAAAAVSSSVEPAPPASESRARAKGDAIPTDAIAAAAAALATSIAVDKLNQPAPARRTHPALPKVRPVIRGASDKLPPWLRLGATAAAPAAFEFEAAPPSPAERIEPMVAPLATDERPEWLVQGQAASDNPPALASETDLPDWLRSAAASQATDQTVESKRDAQTPGPSAPAVAPASDAALPEWLREPGQTQTPASPPPSTPSAVTALPDWLTETQAEPESAPAETTETPTVAEGWTNEPAEPTQPVYIAAIENEPPVAREETERATAPAAQEVTASNPAQAETPTSTSGEKPLDAMTLIENARQRSHSGDVKGALELYERAMHRRPNHLDEIIADLQNIVQNPNAPSTANRLLGEAFAMAGRFKESLEQYRLAMGK
jgi:tetratricopeptide (TPR) repeat protein